MVNFMLRDPSHTGWKENGHGSRHEESDCRISDVYFYTIAFDLTLAIRPMLDSFDLENRPN